MWPLLTGCAFPAERTMRLLMLLVSLMLVGCALPDDLDRRDDFARWIRNTY